MGCNQSYTTLKGTSNYNDSQFMNEIENNLKCFLDWGLLSIGAWTDVSQTGLSSAKLRSAGGQIWQAARKDIVYESGIDYNTSYNPIGISGVYVSGSLKTSNYYVDYPNGQVVFTGGLSTVAIGSDVHMNYSFRNVQTYVADNAPWWKELQQRSFDASDSHFTQDPRTGDWSIGPHNRIQLPAIIIEVIPKCTPSPYEIGNGALVLNQDVLFHILTDNRNTRNKLTSILTLQKDNVIYLFDSNKVSKSGVFPIDYRGSKINGILYPNLVSETGYRWKRCQFMKTSMSEVESLNPKLYEGIVRATLEIVFDDI